MTEQERRDQFAMAALQSGLIEAVVKDWQLNEWFGPYRNGIRREQIIAVQAYAIADAMIKRSAK